MDVSLLRTINIFEGLTDPELEKIFKIAKIKLYPAGKTILEEGKPGGSLHVIIKGKVRITKQVENNKDKAITTLGPQAIYGEMSLFDNLPYSASVVAVEETRCIIIPKDAFTKLLRQELELAFKIMTQIIAVLSQRIRNTNEELVALTTWKDHVKKKRG